MDSVVVRTNKDAFLGRKKGGGPASAPAVFVAYRMSDDSSVKMRADLERALNETGHVTVVDGNVEDGLVWADEIRRRIDKAKLLVVDVTGPSREVLFEYGFAKNKYVVLIVHRRDDQRRLPRWITVIQLPPPYESGEINRIADSVANKVMRRPDGFRNRPAPIPGSAYWIQDDGSTWADTCFERSRNYLAERSIDLTRRYASEIESSEELRECLRSWLVVACMDGLSADYLGHFLLGDVIGRTKAGSGTGRGQAVQRMGIALSERASTEYVAESIRRAAGGSLKTATPDTLPEALRSAADRYRNFLRGA